MKKRKNGRPSNYTTKGPGRSHKQGPGALRLNINNTRMKRKYTKGMP